MQGFSLSAFFQRGQTTPEPPKDAVGHQQAAAAEAGAGTAAASAAPDATTTDATAGAPSRRICLGRGAAGGLFAVLLLVGVIITLTLFFSLRSSAREDRCRCWKPEGTANISEATTASEDVRFSADADSTGTGTVGTQAGVSTQTSRTQDQEGYVYGNDKACTEGTEEMCFDEFSECRGILPFTKDNQPEDCAGELYQVVTGDSCWDLGHHGGNIAEHDSDFSAGDYDDLFETNPRLEPMCRDENGEPRSDGLALGTMVCLRPKMQAVCQWS